MADADLVPDSACPGCGGRFPAITGPVHRYMTSSAGCWRTFGELLAADYSAPERMAFHQIVVDAYAAQHPGEEGPQQVQSVGLHLMTLCLFLEHDVDPKLGTSLHRRMIRRPAFHRLSRTGHGRLTLLHVPADAAPGVARRATYEWATAVWESYRSEQETVRRWLRESGFEPLP